MIKDGEGRIGAIQDIIPDIITTEEAVQFCYRSIQTVRRPFTR